MSCNHFVLLLLLLPYYLLAQRQHPDDSYVPNTHDLQVIPEDFTTSYNQKLFKKHPKWRQTARQQEENWQKQVNSGSSISAKAIYTLPVVVHVIHNNGLSNISQVQVRKGLEQLNEAFANTGFYNSATGVDTEIQFCLARSTPAGLWTNGINYVSSSLAVMDPTTDDAALKNLIQWDANNYINIWVVEETVGADLQGYATFPAAHGSNRDGIVIEWQNIGLTTTYTKNLVHEMAHYLGVLNLYDGGGCVNNDCTADGDRVCDTPPQGNSFSSNFCGFQFNTCSADEDDTSPNNPFRPIALGGLGDQADLSNNYMNPYWLDCVNSFTQGQADRMEFFIINDRNSLLNSTACQSACMTVPTTPSFTTSTPTATVGVPMNFTNTSTNATAYEWYIEGSSIGTTVNASHTFTATGSYWVTLETRNGDVQCTERDSVLIQVYCGAGCQEICDNGIDDNGNGLIDCLDPTCICNTCSGKEANNWYFGYYAAMNFTSGSPEVTYGSNLVNLEACASISDVNGNLLFYTDGRTVWNRQNDIMDNGTGLIGGYTTSNILIVPKPNDPTIYYIFVPDQQGSSRGLTYTEVDLSQNNSLGAVTRKNVNLMGGIKTTEHITAVKHCDNINYWVIVKEWESNNYYSFFITTTGVISLPFVQSIGTPHDLLGSILSNTIGTMRINPQGTKMAICFYEKQGFELYDIDRRTSQLSNPVFYQLTSNPYGMEFSPNGNHLYVTQDSIFRVGSLRQYDLTLSSATATVDSVYIVSKNAFPSNIRLGPDGHIYETILDASYLNVITQPNSKGAACGYQQQAVDLWLGANSYGLPYMLPEQLFPAPISSITGPKQLCAGTSSATYRIAQSECNGVMSITWQHYGSNSIATVTDSTVSLLPTNGGQDTLIATITSICTTTIDTFVVTVIDDLVLDLGKDTSTCLGQALVIDAGSNFDTYLWSDGSQGSTLSVVNAGQYWVSTTNACGGVGVDTIQVDFLPPPVIAPEINNSATNRATVIEGEPFSVTAGLDQSAQGVQYNWTDNARGAEISWNDLLFPTTTATAVAGQYELYITATSALGCSQTGTIFLKVEEPKFLGMPNAFTPNGDGSNDTFSPVGLSSSTIQEFKIFNRWGQLVYAATTGNRTWDGTFQGQQQPADLYIYYLSYQLPGQEAVLLRGEVTLIR